MNELARLFVKLSLDATEYTRGIRRLVNQSASFGQRLGSTLANSAVRAMRVGLIGLTTLLAGLGFSAVSAAGGLESQLSGIQAVLQETTGVTEQLKSSILDLSVDPKLKVSATEAADAVEMLARNGLNADEIMGGALRNTVLLSNAVGGDFATAADVATDVLAQFGGGLDTMQDKVNSITSAVNNSKFGFEDYALALSAGGADAGRTGLAFTDFNAAIVTISSQFKSGRTAGTGFRNFLTRLTPNSKEATKQMKKLGFITADGTNKFFDAQGEIKSMTEIVGVLNKSLAGLSTQQRETSLEMIFGADASKVAGQLAKSTASDFAELRAELAKTSAAENAATRIDNLKGSFEILKSIMQGFAIQLGDIVIPHLNTLTKWASEFASTHGPAVVEMFTGLVNRGADLASAFQSGGFSGLFDELGIPQGVLDGIVNVTDSIRSMSDFVIQNKEAVIGGLKGIGIALGVIAGLSTIAAVAVGLSSLLNPITALVVLAGLIGAAWAENWGGIQQIVGNAVTILSGYIDAFRQKILEFSQSETFANISLILNQIFTALQRTFGPIIQELIASFVSVWPQVQGIFSQLGILVQNVAMIFGTVLAGGLTVATALIAGIASAITQALPPFVAFLNNIITIATSISTLLVSAFNVIISLISGDGEGLQSAMLLFDQTWTTLWLNVALALQNAVATLLELIGGFASGVVEFFANLYEEIVGKAVPDFVRDLIQNYKNLKEDTFQLFEDMINGIIRFFKETDWKSVGLAVVRGIASGIVGGIPFITDAAISAAKSAFDAAKNFLGINSPSTLFRKGIGAFIPEGMALGITDNQSMVTDAVNDLIAIPESISGAYALDFVATGLDSINSDVDSIASNLEASMQAINASVSTPSSTGAVASNTSNSTRIINVEQFSIILPEGVTEPEDFADYVSKNLEEIFA